MFPETSQVIWCVLKFESLGYPCVTDSKEIGTSTILGIVRDVEMVVENPGMKGHHKRPGREKVHVGREGMPIMLIGNSWGLVSSAVLIFSCGMLSGIGSISFVCLNLNRFK